MRQCFLDESHVLNYQIIYHAQLKPCPVINLLLPLANNQKPNPVAGHENLH